VEGNGWAHDEGRATAAAIATTGQGSRGIPDLANSRAPVLPPLAIETDMTAMASHQLVGKQIVSQDGFDVGEVVGFELDVESWSVTAIEVKLERGVLEKLNLERPMFGSQKVRLPIDRVGAVSDKVVLSVTLQDLAFVESANK
jgi:sporulation protein YlmC with PRC-barrel domain